MKTERLVTLMFLLLATYHIVAPTTVSAESGIIYIRSDLTPENNSVFVNSGDFTPICSGNGGSGPRLPGLDLVRAFAGNPSCPATTDNNRFSSQLVFIILVDDTSALSSQLTGYFQSQNLLQQMNGRQVIAPGIRTFQLNGQPINILIVGEMAYRQGGSNPANWFSTLNGLASTPFNTSTSSTVHWIDKCNQEIPVPVPSFSCKGPDTTTYISVEVKKKVKNGKCKKPENLYNRCVHKSQLGRLARNNTKNVDIIFSCRKDKSSNHQGDNGDKFFDIAVIQHHRTTGKTCFYQYLGSSDDHGVNLPAPATAAGKTFWGAERVNYCTSCHTNGPFVRSPHYWQVKDSSGNRILPSTGQITKYKVLHDHYKVFDVSKTNNTCVGCHDIGAYRETSSGPLKIGRMNKVAAGKKQSLSTGGGGPSPTTSGYDDFMAGRGGGRTSAKAALQELENCLATPTPAGCTVTQVSP
jgi:hypothetical protein